MAFTVKQVDELIARFQAAAPAKTASPAVSEQAEPSTQTVRDGTPQPPSAGAHDEP